MYTDLAKGPFSNQSVVRQTLNGSTMGTRYSAVFFAHPGKNISALSAALSASVDRVDLQMSSWKQESDLNRLNAAPIGTWVDIPPELTSVLVASLQVERITHGAFNINVGDLVSAWGFGPMNKGSTLGRMSISSKNIRPPTYALIDLDTKGGRARKSGAVDLDLSGIAKGFGVDEMARVMNEFAIPSWLVGIDGEMRAKGVKPDGSAWAVAHERPDRYKREAMGVIELQDMAVATSGNYRHFKEVDGRTFSHTIDARTSAPLENGIASVSVLTTTCMTADAWATALMVMGVEAGLEAARANHFDVIFVQQNGTMRSTI
jgi:thiamine biosynthesis lipoprotein